LAALYGADTSSAIGLSHQTLLSAVLDRVQDPEGFVRKDVPDDFCGDPTRLSQVLTNLIGNAIKFTKHGEVLLRIELQEHSPKDALLHFPVKDTGPGIPEEKHQAIFATFTQADSSTTRRYGGTGLGLTISSRLVALMNGRIWLESKPNHGSTFHFTVRLPLQQNPSSTQSFISLDEFHGTSVLVVDDNATNRRILEQTLFAWGLDPTLCDGSAQALATLRDAQTRGSPFRLMLIDSHRPELDGFSLVDTLQLDPADSDALHHHAHLRNLGRGGGTVPATGYLCVPHQARSLSRPFGQDPKRACCQVTGAESCRQNPPARPGSQREAS
jgi:CheY-like chemotaxis protein